jgi:hypothetical protein
MNGRTRHAKPIGERAGSGQKIPALQLPFFDHFVNFIDDLPM